MIDLHTHSSISDGSESPTKVVELAKAAKCSSIALTDHDTFEGLAEATKRAEELEINLVPGVEVSCTYPTGTMHLLVYFCKDNNSPLGVAMTQMQEARHARNLQLIELMSSDGIDISYEDLVIESGPKGVGRPHFAAIMLKRGLVSSIDEAFSMYLDHDKKYYIEKFTFEPKDMIALALDSGGLPVLAHPYTLANDKGAVPAIIEELASYGLCGLEAYYGRYTPSQRAKLVDIAHTNSLIPTGGSDFHGSYKPDLKIGIGRGDLVVADEVLLRLSDRHAQLVKESSQ